jgi:putative DNA primase/helicase
MGDFAARMAASRARVAARRRGAAAEAPATDHSNPKIAVLAALDRLHYEQQREAAAAELGIRVSALDKLVRQAQAAVENENTALPHWNVESWPEPVDGAALLDSIEREFRRYIVLPKDADIALALWVLHAWTMDAGDISPFLVLVSPTKRCGKTSVLIILFYLTPKSELASNITASSLFRYIEEVRPTLLIDEADSFVKDNEELRGVLNSGHTKVAANVIRNVEINGEHKPRRFSTWAAKAIATIRSLADTLEDRSVIITLQRKLRNANVERLRRRDTEEFQKLRSQAARWAADNFGKLVDPNPVVPEVLNDRASDNWRPLLAIADLAGGAWPEDATGGLPALGRGAGRRRQRRAFAGYPGRIRRCRGDPVPRPRGEAHLRPGAPLGRVEARPSLVAEAACRALKIVLHHLHNCAPPWYGTRQGLPQDRFRGRLGQLLPWSKHPSGPIWRFRSVQACKFR